jgi:hypothetical protein
MRARTAKEKELADNARLLRWWRAWHREQRELVLSGPHGTVLNELLRVFKNLQHMQSAQLIGYAQSINWEVIDFATKLVVIHELNSAITAFRERRGLEPISDPLPGEPDTPFRMIKAIMFTPSPPREDAHRGEARPE